MWGELGGGLSRVGVGFLLFLFVWLVFLVVLRWFVCVVWRFVNLLFCCVSDWVQWAGMLE